MKRRFYYLLFYFLVFVKCGLSDSNPEKEIDLINFCAELII